MRTKFTTERGELLSIIFSPVIKDGLCKILYFFNLIKFFFNNLILIEDLLRNKTSPFIFLPVIKNLLILISYEIMGLKKKDLE
jgi:hypothetical protein